MRVFVTGATGALGRYLVPGLDDPLDWRSIPGAVQMPAAITYVDTTMPGAVPEGIVLRYGTFYGEPRYASWREGFRAWVRG